MQSDRETARNLRPAVPVDAFVFMVMTFYLYADFLLTTEPFSELTIF
jgi:hypothetical protein